MWKIYKRKLADSSEEATLKLKGVEYVQVYRGTPQDICANMLAAAPGLYVLESPDKKRAWYDVPVADELPSANPEPTAPLFEEEDDDVQTT